MMSFESGVFHRVPSVSPPRPVRSHRPPRHLRTCGVGGLGRPCRLPFPSSRAVRCRSPGKSFVSSPAAAEHDGAGKTSSSDDAFGAAGGGYLEVEGGGRLEGLASVGGAKNAVLALLAGTIACRDPVTIRSVPMLKDVMAMTEVLRSLGVKVHVGTDGDGSITVDASQLRSASPDATAVRALRASFFAAGPILVHMPLPGGCNIGTRPVDLHLRGFEALGAAVNITPDGVVHAVATGPGGRLRGAGRHRLRFPSVGATHAIIMAAALAEGNTVLENAAAEPEVADLAAMLNACGASVRGAGTSTVTVEGIGGRGQLGGGLGSDVSGLGGCTHVAIPDRIEAGTMLVAAAVTGSTLTLSPVIPAHLEATVGVLRAAGCEVETVRGVPGSTPGRGGSQHVSYYDGAPGETLRISPSGGPGIFGGRGAGSRVALRSVNFTTEPYPGVPTDMQPQLCVMNAVACGTATVRETVFENRFSHIRELAKMGADARLVTGEGAEKNRVVAISGTGGMPLTGADVRGSDLRASAALVLAGLAAEGVTRVEGLRHLDRGYEGLDDKLVRLGAVVRRNPM